MEFTIDGFIARLREVIYDNFPYMQGSYPSSWGVMQTKEQKHPKTPFHVRDVAFGWLPTFGSGDSFYFDIGSDYAEEYYPYYHILEDSETIRIRGKGTKKTKGSQDMVSKGRRDYGRISFNGKTYTKEYSRNVRGQRSLMGKARRYVVGSDGVVYKINQDVNYYYNVHYKYIERILNTGLPFIAQEFGLKMKRVEDTGLGEEFKEQEETDRIRSIIDSFTEEE